MQKTGALRAFNNLVGNLSCLFLTQCHDVLVVSRKPCNCVDNTLRFGYEQKPVDLDLFP